MTNTTTNRMKRLIADISEHGATPSRVKKITNALRAVTAERDRLREALTIEHEDARKKAEEDLERQDRFERLSGRLSKREYTEAMKRADRLSAALSASSAKKESRDG